MTYPWLTEALQGADFGEQRLLFSQRDAVDRLIPLELRDRWGYHLGPLKLATVARFVRANADHEGLRQRSRAAGAMAEIVDRLALSMMGYDEDPADQFCSGYDTPAEDDLIETVVRTTLNLKEPS